MSLLLAPKPPDIGDTDGFETSDIFQAKAVGERLATYAGILRDTRLWFSTRPLGSGKSDSPNSGRAAPSAGDTPSSLRLLETITSDDARSFPLFGHLLEARLTWLPWFASALEASLIETGRHPS